MRSFATPSWKSKLGELNRPVAPRTNRTLENYRRQFGDMIVEKSDGLTLDVGAGDAGWPHDRCRSRLIRLDVDYAQHPPHGDNAISGDVVRLPFSSGTFDLVVSSQAAALKEMIRVTCAGGRVMIHPTFRVFSRFTHSFPFVYEKVFSNAIGSRPTLVIEKRSVISEAEWDALAESISSVAKLAPNRAARQFRRWYHTRLTNRLGVQIDHRAMSVSRAYLGIRSDVISDG